jgi:hypothetical protein
MHIRSRLHHRRLQISLIDTRRIDGRVRQEHVAALGSVPPDMSVQDRVAFWTKLHPRLSRLDNRLDPSTRARIMGELHKIVPMVPPDAAIAGKVETAKRNVKTSTAPREMFQATINEQKAMLVKLQRDIAAGEAHVAEMADAVKRDEDKLSRLEAGEDVPVAKELDAAAIRALLKEVGWTRSDEHRARRMAMLDEEGHAELIAELRRVVLHDDRRHARALTRVLRRQRDRARPA